MINSNIIYIAVLTLVVLLWFTTIAATTIVYVKPSSTYYFDSLPLSFWLGLFILLFATFFSYLRYKQFIIYCNLLLGVYLYLTPSLIYENVYFTPSYIHATGSEFIKHNSHVTGTLQYLKDYPGFFIYSYIFHDITHLSVLFLIKYLPFIFFILYLISIYVITKSISTKKEHSYLAILFLIAFFWVDQLYFSPQLLAFIYYLGIWLVFLRLFSTKNNQLPWIILLILLSIGICITNPTTMYVTLSILGSWTIFTIIRKQAVHAININMKLITLIYSIVVVLTIGYQSTYSGLIKPSTLLERVTNLAFHISLTPSFSYLLANLLQLTNIAFILITGLFFLLYRPSPITKIHFKMTKIIFIIMFIFLIISPFTRGTYLQRVFMFMLVPWIILIITSLAINPQRYGSFYKIFLLSSLTFMVLLPITKHAHDSFNYVPSSTIHAAVHFAHTVISPSVYFATPNTFQHFKYYMVVNQNDLIIGGNIDEEKYDKESQLIIQEISTTSSHYVVTSRTMGNLEIVRNNMNNYVIDINTFLTQRYSIIYDSYDTKISYVNIRI